MTKAEFFKYCAKNEREDKRIQIRVRSVHRSFDKAVFLDGLWCNGSIVDIVLYTPLAGRQWSQYQLVEKRLEQAKKKFHCWLVEFSRLNPNLVVVG